MKTKKITLRELREKISKIIKLYLMSDIKSNLILWFVCAMVLTVMMKLTIRFVTLIFENINNDKMLGIAVMLLVTNETVSMLLRYMRVLSYKRVQFTLYYDLLDKLALKLPKLTYEFYTKTTTGETINAEKLCDNLISINVTLLNLIRIIFDLLVTFVIFVKSNVMLGGLLFILTISITMIGKKGLEKNVVIEDEIQGYMNGRTTLIGDCVSGFKLVKSFGLFKQIYKSLDDLNNSITDSKMKKNISNARNEIILDTIFTIVLVSSALTLYQMIKNGQMTAGLAVTYITYLINSSDSIFSLYEQIESLSSSVVAYDRYMKIIDGEEEIDNGKTVLETINQNISFNNVSAGYGSLSNCILDNISLSVDRDARKDNGKKVAIVGSSGAGKTTMTQLLTRFYDPLKGSVTIDGIDIREFTLESLRSKIGIVTQDSYMVSGTILDNLKCVSPNATENEIDTACKKAQIYDYIQSLPDKYNTKIGVNGITLSGGEKQRISLARIFLTNKDIIILDEATSALDTKSEKAVKEALNELRGKFVFTVAHRLSTIIDYDMIVVIDNHKIVECGTHEELMKLNGKYAQLVNTQKLEEINL